MTEKLSKYGSLINENLWILHSESTKKIYFFLEELEEEELIKLNIIVSGKNKEMNTEPVNFVFEIERLKYIDYILYYLSKESVRFEKMEKEVITDFLEKVKFKVDKAQKMPYKGRGYAINKNFNLETVVY